MKVLIQYTLWGVMNMSSKAIATVQKMLESLPEEAQERVVEHLREYILDLQDELEWDALLAHSRAAYCGSPPCQRGNCCWQSRTMDFERL
jgi:hypothetical protein